MYWGYGISGFSPCFTHFYLFAHISFFFPSSTLHLIGVLISSQEQRGALRRLGGKVCIVFVLT